MILCVDSKWLIVKVAAKKGAVISYMNDWPDRFCFTPLVNNVGCH